MARATRRPLSANTGRLTDRGFVAYGTAKGADSGETDDIAIAALYLASPASSFVSGKVLEVDGGVEAPTSTWVCLT